MKKIISLCLSVFAIVFIFSTANAQVDVIGSTGADNSYGSLTGAAGAFASINAFNQTGKTITISISSDATTEDGTTALTGAAGQWTTLTITPAGPRTISGNVAGPMITLNGAKNVTINGLNSGGSTLTISNLSATATASTIKFIGDASSNSLLQCTVSGSGTAVTVGTIWFSTGTATGNIGNVVSSCNIGPAGVNLPVNGIFSLGTSAAIPNTVTVDGNKIFDYFSATVATAGINIAATGNTTWSITNNKLYQTATRIFTTGNTHSGIFVGVGAGYTITGNTVGFANSAGTGTTNIVGNSVALGGTFPSSYTTTGTANATRYIAINCAFTAGGASSGIANNTIGGFALYTSSAAATTNGVWCGINLTSGNANISTNTIGATTGQGSIYTVCTTTGGTAVGIYATSINSVSISGNTVGAVDASGTSATLSGGFAGIDCAGAAGVISISSNTIGNSTADNIRTGYFLSGGNLSNAGTATSTTGATGVMLGIRNTCTGTSTITYNTLRGLNIGGTVTTCIGIIASGATATSNTVFLNAIGTSGLGWVRYSFACSGALTGISALGTAAAAPLRISFNDFQGIVHTVNGTNAHTYITFNHGSSVTDSIVSNTFTNLSVATSGSVTFLNRGTTSMTASGKEFCLNNSIVTAFAKTVAGGTVTCYTVGGGGSSPSGSTMTETGNNFSNITLTGATTVLLWSNSEGASSASGPVKTISNNTFNNITTGIAQITGITYSFALDGTVVANNTLTNFTGGGVILALSTGTSISGTHTLSGNTLTNYTTLGGINAIQIGATTGTPCTINVTANTIRALSTSSAGNNIFGVICSGGAATTVTNIYKNKITDLTSDFAGASAVFGVLAQTFGTYNIYNNLVGDLKTPTSTSLTAIQGIYLGAAITANVYNNTVQLNASSTSVTTFGTTCVYFFTTTTSLNMQNNILKNTSTPAQEGANIGTNGTSACLKSTGGTATVVPANYSTSSNKNAYWVNPSAGTNNHCTYVEGTTTITNSENTTAQMKAFMVNRDQASVEENMNFRSIVGTNANYLKIDTTIATQLESGANVIAAPSITNDYYDIARYPNAGYPNNLTTPATAPDIGANEFGGILQDIAGPSISYTALGNTVVGGNQTLTATITDASGVPIAGAGLPVLYWKLNAGAYTAVQGTSTGSSHYDFTFGSATTTPGDVISYYIVAQDNVAPTPNVSASPAGGATGFTFSPPAASTPPTTPSTFTAVGSLSGNKTVGATGDYTTLKAAFDDINAKAVNGNLNLLIQVGGTTETAVAQLNNVAYSGGPNFNITIKPDAGVTATITSNQITPILLNGADYVIIDGSNNGTTSRDLSINTTSALGSSSVIWIQTTAGNNSATNNTVKNCNIAGNSNTTTLFGVGSGSPTISIASLGVSNNNITIQNNNISKVQYGIFTQGTAATKNTGTVISDNLLNTAAPDNIALGGIFISNESGCLISANNISNILQTGGTTDVFGITCGTTAVTTSTFIGTDNPSVTISKNIIGVVTHTATYSAIGIYYGGSTTGTSNIVNNSVYGVGGNPTSGDFTSGIFMSGVAGSTTNIYYNSISMTGTFVGGSDKIYGIAVGGANPTVNIKNNIVNNTQVNGTGVAYGIELGYSTYTNLASNYNNIYCSGQFGGTTSISAPTSIATLAAWRTATSNDASSLSSVAVGFTSVTNLAIDATSPNAWNVHGLGTQIAGINTDILGSARSTTVAGGATDIGAYNVTPSSIPPTATASAPPANSTTTTYTSPGGQLLGSIAWGAGGTVPSSVTFTFYPGTNPPGTPGGFKVANGYWVITVPDGAGYTYDITLNYDDAMLGTITPEANVRLVKSENGGGVYTPFITPGVGPGQYQLNTVLNTIQVFGLTTFSTFGLGDNDLPLPVELSSFTANIDRRNVDLKWSTASELNNAGFDIERKLSASTSWSKVGFVAGNGTTNTVKNYSFEDKNLETGKYNYRLKQIDVNGNVNYHQLSSLVDVGVPTKFDISQNYPNPFNPSTKINYDLPFDSKVSIRIFDMTGKEVATVINSAQTAGYYTVQFNGSNLASGVYFYNIIAEGGNAAKFITTKKMVLVK